MEQNKHYFSKEQIGREGSTETAKTALFMNKKDNVATLLSEAAAGDIVMVKASDGSIVCVTRANGDIVRGHKIALKNIADGNDVIKYGFSIGKANGSIIAGDYVHTHNLVSGRGRGDL